MMTARPEPWSRQANGTLMARQDSYGVSKSRPQVQAVFLTWDFAAERVTGIEPALSAWEVGGAARPPPADWLTCGCADTLTVRDRDYPRWLLCSGT